VDLRWGITEAQANEGQVLPLCLAEIERSRPYFIGLLGERYGWVNSRGSKTSTAKASPQSPHRTRIPAA
jgi:hypothetical protein